MKAREFNGPFLKKLFSQTLEEFSSDNVMRLSAALSYYSVFSIAPLLLIAIGVAGWIFGPEAAQGKITEQLSSLVGAQAAEAIQSIVESANKDKGGATIIGFVTLLVGASTVFGQLKDALNTIWEVKPKPGLGISAVIKERLFSFGMVLAVGFLLLVSFVATATVAATMGWIEQAVGLPKAVTGVVGLVVPLSLEVALFATLFKYVPDAKVKWENVWFGAAVTAVLFELGKIGLSFYFAKGSATSSFGAAGSVVLVLLWVYYASTILFVGAEMTEVYARLTGHSIQPAENAVTTHVSQDGEPASGIEAAHARMKDIPVTAHPLAEGAPARVPARESLAPVLAQAAAAPDPFARPQRSPVTRRAEPEPVRKFRNWLERLPVSPVAEVGVALGLGVVAGLASRVAEGRGAKELSATEHFRKGSEDLAGQGKEAVGEAAERLLGAIRKMTA